MKMRIVLPLVVLLAVWASAWFSGRFVLSGGMGGWLVWLLLSFLLPLIVAFFFGGIWRFLTAISVSIVISTAILYRNWLWLRGHSEDPLRSFAQTIPTECILFIIATAIGIMAAFTVHLFVEHSKSKESKTWPPSAHRGGNV